MRRHTGDDRAAAARACRARIAGWSARRARDAVAVLRVGEADRESVARARATAREALAVEGADDRPLGEAVPHERVRQLVEPGRQLQVDVQRDVVPGQERERLVERRQLGRELAQLRQRAVADACRAPRRD